MRHFAKALLVALLAALVQSAAIGVLVAWAVTRQEIGPLDERWRFMVSAAAYCTLGFAAVLAPVYLVLGWVAARGVARRPPGEHIGEVRRQGTPYRG